MLVVKKVVNLIHEKRRGDRRIRMWPETYPET
jgi:hypothetical protein